MKLIYNLALSVTYGKYFYALSQTSLVPWCIEKRG